MKTTKPIATISYNSKEFLQHTLQSLVKAKKVSFWAFIPHKAEDDEKKDHFHVYVEPACSVQTLDLEAQFIEFVAGSDKPLKTISFRSSKFADWFLYAIHDEAYLLTKNETRRFHYSQSDIVTSDLDDLEFLVKQIDRFALSPYGTMVDAIKNGVSMQEFFRRGLVNMNQVSNFIKAWEFLEAGSTFRASRSGHEDLDVIDVSSVRDVQTDASRLLSNSGSFTVLDTETGEVITELPKKAENV